MHRDGANYLNLLFTVYYDMCVYFKYIFHLPMGVVAPAQGAICIVFLRYKLKPCDSGGTEDSLDE